MNEDDNNQNKNNEQGNQELNEMADGAKTAADAGKNAAKAGAKTIKTSINIVKNIGTFLLAHPYVLAVVVVAIIMAVILFSALTFISNRYDNGENTDYAITEILTDKENTKIEETDDGEYYISLSKETVDKYLEQLNTAFNTEDDSTLDDTDTKDERRSI